MSRLAGALIAAAVAALSVSPAAWSQSAAPGARDLRRDAFPSPDPPLRDLVGVWTSVSEGLWERRLDRDGDRVERLGLGEFGLLWAADRLGVGRDFFEDQLDRLGRGAEAERVQLESDLDTLDEALLALLDAADDLAGRSREAATAEGTKATEDPAEPSRLSLGDCDFAFDVGTGARGWRPASWVYPFGIRAEASSTWAAKCGARATVVSVVEIRAGSLGFDPEPFTSFDGCTANGVAAACSSRARVAGFSPCRALVRSMIAAPDLGFYFEAEEVSNRCSRAPNFPDPADAPLWFR